MSLHLGHCPPDELGLQPRHIVDVEVVRRDELAMRIVEFHHETCRHCGATDDTATTLDYSLPFEADLIGVPTALIGSAA